MRTKIEELKQRAKGEIILPNDKNYDEARTIYNAMIDKHPAIIFKCKDVDDVIAAVNFGRENGLEVSIRSGGHNGAGLALVEGGLVHRFVRNEGYRSESSEKNCQSTTGQYLT